MANNTDKQSRDSNAKLVVFKTSQNAALGATVIRVNRSVAVFEFFDPSCVLRLSEVLKDFQISLGERTIFQGQATIQSLVDTGLAVVCEVSLMGLWSDVDFETEGDGLRGEFAKQIGQWKKSYMVLPEYKILAADLHIFLTDFRQWMNQVEFGINGSPAADRLQLEQRWADQLSLAVFPYLDEMFAKLEQITAKLDADQHPAHSAYIRRLIQPLVIGAPFAFRAIRKPLGYAGDYEVVDMILRNPYEGGSLYAKVLNHWFIKQPPAEAHRNRIKYLTQRLLEETARTMADGRKARVYNLGCGPAREIQDFMAEQHVSDHAHFTLLDFNEETLRHAQKVLEQSRKRSGRNTVLKFTKKSVAQVLKGRNRASDQPPEDQYDFIYCAGLFDYLSQSACKHLMNVFYELLAPGGLLVATNVDSSNPIQHWLGDVLEWHLIYRGNKEMLALRPDQANLDDTRVVADITGVNIFLEVRKPLA